jgi:hypothetical protein
VKSVYKEFFPSAVVMVALSIGFQNLHAQTSERPLSLSVRQSLTFPWDTVLQSEAT